jgi:DNA-binding transcriptional regulator YdaS (Cro superfamily)
MQSGIEAAIQAAGKQALLAEAIGVSQQAVSRWRRRGYVPVCHVVQIESQFGVPRATLVSPRVLDLLDTEGAI